jgi:hypothetical protein
MGPHLLLSISDWSRLIGTGVGTRLASLTTERVVGGRRDFEVTRLQITETGRRGSWDGANGEPLLYSVCGH